MPSMMMRLTRVESPALTCSTVYQGWTHNVPCYPYTTHYPSAADDQYRGGEPAPRGTLLLSHVCKPCYGRADDRHSCHDHQPYHPGRDSS